MQKREDYQSTHTHPKNVLDERPKVPLLITQCSRRRPCGKSERANTIKLLSHIEFRTERRLSCNWSYRRPFGCLAHRETLLASSNVSIMSVARCWQGQLMRRNVVNACRVCSLISSATGLNRFSRNFVSWSNLTVFRRSQEEESPKDSDSLTLPMLII